MATLKIFIGIAADNDPFLPLAEKAIRAYQRDCPFEIVYPGPCEHDVVGRSRNNLAAAALETDCSHVLFHDCDNRARPAALTRLVSHGLPIVGGLYAKKQPRLAWVASSLDGETRDERTGLQKVSETGTGFLLIARNVFETMIARLPEIAYRGDPSPEAQRWDFFPMHAEEGRYLSEDWAFCKRARALGFDVHVDWGAPILHRGMIDYPLFSTLTDEDLVDLIHNVTGHPAATIRDFITTGPHYRPPLAA